MPKFRNRDGSLTRYALACGYVQRLGTSDLYREHSCYHVIARVDGKILRESTWSLTEARKFLRKLGK